MQSQGQSQQTGTRNETYNVIAILYHALQGAENCQTYLQDADDGQIRDFVQQALQTQRQLADRGKEVLQQCLQKDTGGQSASVLRWANSLAVAFKSTFTILHVVPRLDSPGEEYYAHEWRRHLVARASEKIAHLQEAEGTHAEIVLETGEVSDAIARTAGKLGADVVIIGRGEASDARLGTHAYNIVRRSPCPVVSI